MKENNKKLVGEWFKKAEDDEKAVENLLKEKGPFSVICFLSQQMAEKYLKGRLVFNGRKFRKTHDLGVILELCKKIDKNFSKLEDDCDFLTRYYIATRYPGEFLEGISEKEADKAFKKAKELKEFILNKLKF